MIKKGDVVVIRGSWCDLMTVDRVEDDKVFFTNGDYASLSVVRLADLDEIEVGCKLD